jgi:phenylalanyl-tRNA synthetase beta subunit
MDLSESEEDLPIDNLDTKSENSDAYDDTALPISLYLPHHVHHLSFWISNELSESLLAQIINTSVGRYVLNWRTIDLYTSASGRQSQTIELEYCHTRRALGHSRVMHLHNKVLGLSLVKCAHVQLRC